VYTQTLASAQRAQQVLEAHLPIPQRDPASLTPHLDDPGVSASEKGEFMNLYRVVNDPLKLFEETVHGTITDQQVGAVKFISPGIYKQMVSEMNREVAKQIRPVPYQREISIGTFRGSDTNEVLNRDFQDAMAASFADKAKGNVPQGSKPMNAQSKLSKDLESTTEKVQRGDI